LDEEKSKHAGFSFSSAKQNGFGPEFLIAYTV
jgi:hypothetical protein